MIPMRPACHARSPAALPGARARWLAWVLCLAVAASATGAPVKTPHVEAELVAGNTALVPGVPMPAALRLRMEPG